MTPLRVWGWSLLTGPACAPFSHCSFLHLQSLLHSLLVEILRIFQSSAQIPQKYFRTILTKSECVQLHNHEVLGEEAAEQSVALELEFQVLLFLDL